MMAKAKPQQNHKKVPVLWFCGFLRSSGVGGGGMRVWFWTPLRGFVVLLWLQKPSYYKCIRVKTTKPQFFPRARVKYFSHARVVVVVVVVVLLTAGLAAAAKASTRAYIAATPPPVLPARPAASPAGMRRAANPNATTRPANATCRPTRLPVGWQTHDPTHGKNRLMTNTPVVTCERVASGLTTPQFRFWCPHCKAHHHHGGEPDRFGIIGHRVAHCFVAASPFKRTGYVLRVSR